MNALALANYSCHLCMGTGEYKSICPCVLKKIYDYYYNVYLTTRSLSFRINFYWKVKQVLKDEFKTFWHLENKQRTRKNRSQFSKLYKYRTQIGLSYYNDIKREMQEMRERRCSRNHD